MREQILKQRRALSEDERERLSFRVCARAIEALEPANLTGLKVALYRPLPDELNVATLESWLSEKGARLHYPRVARLKDRLLEFVEVGGERLRSEDSWENGPYGIMEPKAHMKATAPLELDLLFVPGVVFTSTGRRQGMGAGFYDRFLPRARTEALRIALAFDFQVVSALEQEPWDQPVHWVLTENRDLRAAPLLIEKLI